MSTTSPSYVSHSLDEDNPLHWLKAVLKTTTEKLEMETRRANQTEHRAEMSEYREKEEHAKVLQAEMARHQAELDTARAEEELKRYRVQLEANKKELRRAEDRITALETQRSDAQREATVCRQAAENAQRQLREYRAREEGRLLGMTKGYHEGKLRGWSAGRSEGYSRGRAVGREEGWEEGEEEGRVDERRRAVEAMESVLAEEEEYDNDTCDQKVSMIKDIGQNNKKTDRLYDAEGTNTTLGRVQQLQFHAEQLQADVSKISQSRCLVSRLVSTATVETNERHYSP